MILELVDDPQRMQDLATAWAALASEAADPNPFFERWMVLPAARAMRGGAARRPGVLACFAPGPGGAGRGELVALLPVAQQRHRPLPVVLMTAWLHPHAYLGTPLVHRDSVEPAVRALCDWWARRGDGLVVLPQIAEGRVHRTLVEVLVERGWPSALLERVARAVFRPHAGGDPDEYLRAVLGAKRVRELRRLWARLEAEGALVVTEARSPEEAAGFTREFLALEAAGWKGRNGTALASSPEHRAFFEETMREAAARGCLEALALRIDGRPIAMLVNFWSGGAGVAFKCAYDEAYARHSPGILLEVESLRRRHRQPTAWLDSCAAPEARHMQRLYADRRLVETMVFAPRRGRMALVQLYCALHGLRRKLGQVAWMLALQMAYTIPV